MFRNTFCPGKHLCFLAGKSHSTLLRGWLRDSGYPIFYDLPLFFTIRDCSPLFALFETIRTIHTIRYSGFAIRNSLFWIIIRIIRDHSHYSYYSLFAIRVSLFAIRYSELFAVRYSRLFAIRYSLFANRVSRHSKDYRWYIFISNWINYWIA